MLQPAPVSYIDTHLVDVADKVEVREKDCRSSRSRIALHPVYHSYGASSSSGFDHDMGWIQN